MGAIADSFVAYAQPLLDESDGTEESFRRAMTMAQMCWNFALMPEDRRDAAIEEVKPALNMTDEVFAEFRLKFILPMIRRHRQMFPGLHARFKPASILFDDEPPPPPPKKKPVVKDRYAPCPCGSGRKYKWCCGARR